MIRRILCWLMDVCPVHWQPKHWSGESAHHADDDELLICLACERERQPVRIIKTCQHGFRQDEMCGRCIVRLINDPKFRARVERGEV